MEITNIFLQIKDIKHQLKLIKIDELSKKFLHKSIKLQYEEFIKEVEPAYLRLDTDFFNDYPHIRYIEPNDTPLEHCMINNFIYPQDGTGFMNYYNRGIIGYLIDIGFTSDMDKIKKVVVQYKSSH